MQPSRAPDERPLTPETPPRTPRLPLTWWTLVMLLLVGWNLVYLLPSGGPEPLDYTTFRAQLAAGNVRSVDISGQTITGTLIAAIPQPAASPTLPAASAAASPSQVTGTPAPSAGTAMPGITTAGVPFQTVMPAFGDPGLLPAMIAKGVTVSVEDTTSAPGILPDLLGTVLPIALLLGFGIWTVRRLQGAGAGILGFGGSKPRVYTAERPDVTFVDVAGEEDAKAELREIVDYLRDRTAFDRVGARLPRGVLLVGPPGTGKTLLARAVAGEARVPFFSISGSEFVEMFVGVGASRVRDLFAKAKASGPAIVFVDEVDAVGRRRSAGPMSNDEREQTLNQLLVEMDGFDDQTRIIVIGATNRPDVLDPALLRPGRFDREITVGYPDRDGREAILRIHGTAIQLGPSVDLAAIARQTPGLSGADLANLVNEAALLAARSNHGTVEAADFAAAMDRITLGSRHASLTNPAERRLVAYHEAGHALVASLTPGADPVDRVTIVPHGRALGATLQLPDEDRHNYPRDVLLGKLTVLLGGRAAEELVFGQPTTGAESDLREATRIARQMVGAWGMSPDVGPVSFPIDDPAGSILRTEYAEYTAARIDAGVRQLLEEAQASARSLLTGHRAALDALAAELLSSEIVDRATVARIVHGGPRPRRARPVPSGAHRRAVDGDGAATPGPATRAPAAKTPRRAAATGAGRP